jgi:putative oxygen-independent coproporphyrinogen III oxidase
VPSLPDGDPAPRDGRLPDSALARFGQSSFSIYAHVPFCITRCGYCDFNTYTASELGTDVRRDTWANAAVAELRLARQVLGTAEVPVSTIFFGGGTPTLLDPSDLGALIDAVRTEFGVLPGAEITVEANPETVTEELAAGLVAAGVNRVSMGMQSAVPHVLATLDRTHNPANVPIAMERLRTAGIADVSVDLIYGTPGESLDDWRTSVQTAIALEPDHISAYSLTIEPGTKLYARVKRGEVASTDEDDLAAKYELADDLFYKAGLTWYEVSNWATGRAHRSRHNLAYWTGGDWWGIGPGAHSHVGGVRWWNVKHPAAWQRAVLAGESPAAGREVLDADAEALERVLLGVRIVDGLPLGAVPAAGRGAVPDLVRAGLLDPMAATTDQVVLTREGRLLADTVVRALVP